ncbi:MAG: helicase-related protein [Eubacteriales bacterium]|nr:helicase-related protein [Eubacteriales bacterium]
MSYNYWYWKKRKQKEQKARQRSREERRKNELREFLLDFDVESLREYALTMDRCFVLHIGPTNSGKTYESIQALKNAESGAYLGPLRLLALEMYDNLNEAGIRCNLLTGEESVMIPGANHTSSTIELCDYDRRIDVAVIDEAQMITDPFRGDRWARAIYMVNASEVHICLAPEAKDLIISILESFNAQYVVHHHERLAPLSFEGPFKSIRGAKPGDALIVFSRKAVLSVSAELEHSGIKSSVIYGALPPVSRREEVRKFSTGETSVVVATDAIGMGISLPIKRVIFCETMKYDGVSHRRLNASEIKQIAGRAGRYGIYDHGEVLSMSDYRTIKEALNTEIEQADHITLPFPEAALELDYPLDELMKEWNKLPSAPGFLRADMSEALELYKSIKQIAPKIEKHLLYKMITCPVDIKNGELVKYWARCAMAIFTQKALPEPDAGTDSLEECELRYKELDVRHQMLRRIGIEEDRMEEKLVLCKKINEFLEKDKDRYLRRCSYCGKVMPSTSSFGMCDKCYHKMQIGWFNS